MTLDPETHKMIEADPGPDPDKPDIEIDKLTLYAFYNCLDVRIRPDAVTLYELIETMPATSIVAYLREALREAFRNHYDRELDEEEL